MVGLEPPRDGAAQRPTSAADPAGRAARRAAGSKPIVWRWWLAAALVSLMIWAALIALVT